jgi:hypothetical protein
MIKSINFGWYFVNDWTDDLSASYGIDKIRIIEVSVTHGVANIKNISINLMLLGLGLIIFKKI